MGVGSELKKSKVVLVNDKDLGVDPEARDNAARLIAYSLVAA